jgi:hypothetical protein
MPEDTPLPVLLATRLWLPGLNGEPPKPNPQFHGMALKPMRDERGRKVRDAQGKPKLECDWTVEPDLIPYWDWREPDRLLALRPHKGMMRGETPRFYVVRRRFEEGTVRLATIHEGEFKAAAMDQTMNFKQQTGLVAASAIPGITMWKPLLPEIEEWLQSLGNPMVLVSFDSENKEDPRLPGYQPDVWRRHDAEIQARLLALKLAKKGHKLVRVAPPDRAWRNARGKADWDGVLAGEVQSLKSKV